MNSVQIIIILVAVAAIGGFGYLRSDRNEYAEREVVLASVEATQQWFTLKPEANGELKLFGVQ